MCARKRGTAKRTAPQSQRDKEAALQGIRWLEPCTGATKKTLAACNTCEYEWNVTPGSIQGGTGCPRCSGKTSNQERRDAEALAVNCEWTEPYTRALDPTGILCLECGHEWKTLPSRVQQGSGCPKCVHNAAVDQDEWDRRAAIQGLVWLEDCGRAQHPTLARCLTCEHEWRIQPASVKSGSGCPNCAGKIVTQHRRDEQAAAVSCEWLEICGNAIEPKRIRCLTCRNEWKAAPAWIGAGSACPECGRRRTAEARKATQAQRDAEAKSAGIRWTEPYSLSWAPTGAACLTCGHEWKARPANIQQGQGCPNCAESGFNPTKWALLYLLVDRKHVAKIGITNSPLGRGTGRIRQHERNGWEVVDTWEFTVGKSARDAERSVLDWWRNDLGLPAAYEGLDGSTETVDTKRLPLDEIRRFVDAFVDLIDAESA